jgi:hypothetical protein
VGAGAIDGLGDPELLIVVAKQELALQDGKDFVAEFVGVDARFLHFRRIRIHSLKVFHRKEALWIWLLNEHNQSSAFVLDIRFLACPPGLL